METLACSCLQGHITNELTAKFLSFGRFNLLGFQDPKGLVLALGHSSKKGDIDSLVITWL